MDDFEQLDHYSLLGVSRSATADEIKRAYRQQMARFHPDRFAGAPPEQQAYASRRAQRINEAYAVLSDFAARTAYNRSLAAGSQPGASRPAKRPTPAQPAAPRDHLAELYEQAKAHLAAGRAVQAAATLREIQQLNPFYKDSAALLAEAESAARPAAGAGRAPAAPDRGRRALVTGGLGALALIGLGAVGWALRGRGGSATAAAVPTPGQAAGGALETPGPSAPPASTGAPPTAAPAAAPSPTSAPSPTIAPSPTSAPSPTIAPSPTSAPSPTAAPASPTPSPIPEGGPLLYAEDFSAGRGWPSLSGQGWSVGFASGGYQIVADDGAGNIWAYSTAPAAEFLLGADVMAEGGLAGLLLRFSEAGYLAFFVDPALGSYRLERRDNAGVRVLAEDSAPSAAVGPGAVNRLVARVSGLDLALRINGQPVYEQSVDAPPPSARYGLIAVARGRRVVATFSNLTLRGL